MKGSVVLLLLLVAVGVAPAVGFATAPRGRQRRSNGAAGEVRSLLREVEELETRYKQDLAETRKCRGSPTLARLASLLPEATAPLRRGLDRGESIARSALEMHLPELRRLLTAPAAAAMDEAAIWVIRAELKWHRDYLDMDVQLERKFPEVTAQVRALCGL